MTVSFRGALDGKLTGRPLLEVEAAGMEAGTGLTLRLVVRLRIAMILRPTSRDQERLC